MLELTATQPSAVDPLRSSLMGLKVYLVEDEALVAMLVEELLVELGCEIGGTASSVGEAVSQIESGLEFDVAILDINLGGENSFPIAEALVAHDRPFIFATGLGGADIAQRYPGIPLLLKPYSGSALARSLERLIRR